MPQRRGAPTDPTVFIHVQNAFHPGLSAFPRHSNESTRTIRSARISRRAR
jgi:hypothetical protein